MSYALLIDDNQAIRDDLAQSARNAGLVIETASSWDEGLAAFHALSPEVVIADYNLEGAEMGLTLLYRLAQLRPSVRLILFSAYLTDDDGYRLRELGFVDRFLSKTDAVYMASEILEEVAAARERSTTPTDWIAFATAARESEATEEEVQKLDSWLRSNRLGKA